LSGQVKPVRLIDRALLDEVSREAASSPRRRKNRNLHPSDDFPAHRLLNAVEPGSYVMPHRHLAADKDETIVVLRGRFGLLLFDDGGKVVQKILLEAAGPVQGVDLPHGTWHTLVALETGSVFFEAKAGPYAPLCDVERAPWAPAEAETEAAARCVDEWAGLFGAR
jgi:cupin fold WbuC family metalloprotein